MALESDLVRDLVVEIASVAAELSIDPKEVTKSQFLKTTKKFSEWHLRKVGGLNALKKSYFPENEKDLKMIELNKQRDAHIKKLEKRVGKSEVLEAKLVETIGREIADLQINSEVLDKKETKKFFDKMANKEIRDDAKRSIVAIWSDQHFGTFVDKEEVSGLNGYDWVIGARRLGMLCEQIATYKIEKRHLHEELVILLLGDNIAGIIHDQEGYGHELIMSQCAGAAYYYMQAILYLKQFFPKIRVICQPGNHGRMMHKGSKDRAIQNKWDSYENMVCFGLSMKFQDDPDVIFEVTRSPVSDVTIQGHRIYATHGDTVFETGNVGKSINIAKIESQISRVNMEAAHQGEKQFEMFCTGHVHHPLLTHVGPGVQVVINGCLVGTDNFAHAGAGIHSNTPAQVLWECTKSFVQGDVRQIYVKYADTKPEFEKIIVPYQHELAVPKFLPKSK
jgi:hypothetical protein